MPLTSILGVYQRIPGHSDLHIFFSQDDETKKKKKKPNTYFLHRTHPGQLQMYV